MLAEFFRYLATPCPRYLRRLGYLKECIGLDARYDRCRDAWKPHLTACREAILAAAEACPRRGRVAILGSGGLHDVPLEDLACRFDEVLLVDLIHLPRARRRMRPLANVRAVESDVTGVLATLDALSTPSIPDADLVVSLNLLFQLPVLPRAFLEKAGRAATEIDAFCRALVVSHLAALPKGACLITETEHLLIDRTGAVTERDAPLAGFVLPYTPLREWTWDIAPRPEAHADYDLRYRVAAFKVG
jgi:hypothetical protein